MCGIVGVVSRRGAAISPVLLKRMTDQIIHRGPDGEGIWSDGAVGLGHRRLSIIDLTTAGHQPMVSSDGRYALSYNGEVYNYRELRAELEALGHTFRSQTDSEVVLIALAVWGKSAILRFNGMFSFALWDRSEKKMLLGRDRYGIKPLYYSKSDNFVLFASEAKAIVAHPDYTTRLDQEALVEYLTFQNMFSDRTLFEGIRTLPPGHTLEFSPQGELPSPVQYWDFHFREGEKASKEELVEELDLRLRRAVSRHLVSDVEVGALLSGGMDSGTLVALASKELPFMRTFTGGFDLSSASGMELAFDERQEAEHMSAVFKTEHYEMVMKAGDMERVFEKLAWHLEEPRVGQSYPNFYVSQLASKFCTVLLSGTGGDELFGGYPWRYYRAVVNSSFDDYVDKYYEYWQRLVPAHRMPNLLSPLDQGARSTSTRDIFASVFRQHSSELSKPEDYVNHSLYFEAKTFLQGLLTMEDKLSMAHSLETRVPFLDNDLVDLAMRIPVSMKLGNLGEVIRLNENEVGPKTQKHFSKTRDGKLILREVMGRHIPQRISQGMKQGFSAPDASWFRGDSIHYVRSLLLSKNARIHEYLNPTETRSLIEDHLSGRENRRLLIWSLLSIEWWLRTYLN